MEKLAKKLNCSPEKVRCEGCLALTSDCWGNECKILQCLKNKGVEFCYQCNEYEKNSCEKFGKLARGYLDIGVDLRANLERIKKGETEEWLHESAEKHKCPSCGKPLPVYGIKGNAITVEKTFKWNLRLKKTRLDKEYICVCS